MKPGSNLRRAVSAALCSALIAATGCSARKHIVAADAPLVPHKVLVLTVDPVGHASVSWPGDSGFAMAVLFGAIGAGIQASAQHKHEAKMAEKLSTEIGPWNYQEDLQRIFLSTATPHPGWTFVDGQTLDPMLRAEITRSAVKHDALTPGVIDYATREGIDRVLTVEASFYGVDRKAGYRVKLEGDLLAVDASRRVLTTGNGQSPEKDLKSPQTVYSEEGANDGAAIKAALLTETEHAAHLMMADLGTGD